MISKGFLHQHVTQEWQYGLLGGVVALPFTVFSYWQTGSELSLAPVFVGGFLAGYLAKQGIETGRGIGLRAGLVGGLAVIWILFDILSHTSALAGPSWFVFSATLFTIGFSVVIAILGFGLAALIGEAGARVGSWFA